MGKILSVNISDKKGKKKHNVGECVMPKEGIFVRVLSEGNMQIGDDITIRETS